MKMLKKMVTVMLVLAMMLSTVSVLGVGEKSSRAALVDAIPIQIGEIVKGRWDSNSQDGTCIYYSFQTTAEKAFYSVSMNTNASNNWRVCKETDRNTALRRDGSVDYYNYKTGTGTIDLGNALKPNTTYYVLLSADKDCDDAYEFRIDKYVDDIGDDRTAVGQIQMNTEYSYKIENGADVDVFEFTTENTDYNLTVSAPSGIRYNIYKDDLLTVPVFSYYKDGTKVVELDGVLNRNTKYWLAFWGTWDHDYEPYSYTFKFESSFKLERPSVYLTSKKGRKVKLSWSPIKDATGYEIYRAIGYGSTYKKIKTLSGTSWTSKKQKKGKTYYYKVVAFLDYGGKKFYSEGSNEVYKYF